MEGNLKSRGSSRTASVEKPPSCFRSQSPTTERKQEGAQSVKGDVFDYTQNITNAYFPDIDDINGTTDNEDDERMYKEVLENEHYCYEN